ncbi:MAG: DUF4382 domain-containing protein [Candidatus Palauibacterales bacterium]|nr:DUF4382 domain-containing protein [Candidatus Palauibacterales bacterium]MDP2529702.1 DUF4382 domain-containing protein [Candidatus Palauibacterales bacterium]MDP2584118.1 DUF4382 domain-containing protein [Candidatus Palauibacterales bacterium]
MSEDVTEGRAERGGERRGRRARARAGILAGAVAAALALGACGQSGVTAPAGSPRVSLLLKDAPGDVTHAWVDVKEVYLQGRVSDSGASDSGRVVLLDKETGLIDLTRLADSTMKLADQVVVPAGTYSQLRLVLGGAVVETSTGVYSLDGAVPPNGDVSAPTGRLRCPSCQQSGLKVNLPGGALDLQTGSKVLVLDFDVTQSFGHVAGASGAWVMHPVIRTSTVETSGSIEGKVTLADSVTVPACGGSDRSIQDFVPTATATPDTSSVTEQGAVQADGSYAIDYLAPATWTMGYVEATGYDGGDTLRFTATADPATVDVTSGATASSDFTVTGAECSAAGG